MNKSNLTPIGVFEQFKKINGIPRPSKHEEKIVAYLKEFAEQHGLDFKVDSSLNVIIRKGATPGYENRKTVILQSHTDMVCDKLVDIEFDFNKDAIQSYVDGDWMKAKGTTLGADDGIGVAIELAILAAKDIEHGPLECVFTSDEETQLTGASGMGSDFMTGDMLINLDSEDEGQIFVSCAGGRSTRARFHFKRETANDYFFLELSLKGLTGGHSGDDINKKRANAIKVLSRFVYMEQEKFDVRLSRFDSGKLHNAIPRDGRVVIAVPNDVKEQVRADWNVFASEVEAEFHVTDTAMVFGMESVGAEKLLPTDVSRRLIQALQAMTNGIFAMCQDKALGDLVETSSNVAAVKTSEDSVEILASQRSNVMSNLTNQCNAIKAVFQLAGADVEQTDGYPAWQMNPNSELTRLTVEAYKKLFGKNPIVRGIHAGLECGLFSTRYPHLDMVSFGPTLRDVHTPDERLYIPTVQMVWDHLLEILKNIPVKQH